MNDHARNTAAMIESLRRGARTRTGGSCRSPAVRGKRRCHMHGGTPKSGAPRRNRNAHKHGRFTKTAIAERTGIEDLLAETRKLMQELK